MSNLALMEVQKALYTKLSGDGVLMGVVTGVYDVVPQKTALPYVVLGDGVQAIAGADNVTLSDCRLEIHVWGEASGRKTVLSILNRVYALLHLGTITVAGHQLVTLRTEQATTVLDEQGTHLRGTLGILVTVAEV